MTHLETVLSLIDSEVLRREVKHAVEDAYNRGHVDGYQEGSRAAAASVVAAWQKCNREMREVRQ